MDNILGTSPEKAKESSKKYYVRKELKDSIKKSFDLDDRKIAQLKEFIKNDNKQIYIVIDCFIFLIMDDEINNISISLTDKNHSIRL